MCWGENSRGQLGSTVPYRSFSAVEVSGLASGGAAVSAGYVHTCAMTSSGGVKCWGDNALGQLGDGTSVSSNLVPVNVSALTNGITFISAGDNHTCALTAAGAVKCWGSNISGQLGIGTTSAGSNVPVDVPGLAADVMAIAAGGNHACALTIGGALKCWGDNSGGQIGDGTTVPSRVSPTDVGSLSSNVVAMAAGHAHTCAVTAAGAAKCWGLNFRGEIGDGTGIKRLIPVDVSGLSADVKAIAAGYQHSCAQMRSGAIKCWGADSNGELGDNAAILYRLTPVNVAGSFSNSISISAGGSHTCAVRSNGAIDCWGRNYSGQLGTNTTTLSRSPVAVKAFASEVAEISVGTTHVCVRTTGGSVKCLGSNSNGQLGVSSTALPVSAVPVEIAPLTSGIVAIAAGSYHSCALTGGGAVKCWGQNVNGQLGNGTTTSSPAPVSVTGLPGDIVAIASGYAHSCALSRAGAVKCWGGGMAGAVVGDGSTVSTARTSPVAVIGLSSGITAIAAQLKYTCALNSSGAVSCWGIGSSTRPTSAVPISVPGLSSGVVALGMGHDHSCAILTSGVPKCWGANSKGQLGDGTQSARSSPVSVSGLSAGVMSIGGGFPYTCASTDTGAVKCWGSNTNGELGNPGSGTRSLTPVDVPSLSVDVKTLDGGNDQVCALTYRGAVYCWGGVTGWGVTRTPTRIAEFNNTPSIDRGSSVGVQMSMNSSPTPFALTLNAIDPDGDGIVWSVARAALNGTATVSSGGTSPSISYVPRVNFSGTDSFLLQATDAYGRKALTNVFVRVSPP